jgi:hypothetical protein
MRVKTLNVDKIFRAELCIQCGLYGDTVPTEATLFFFSMVQQS